MPGLFQILEHGQQGMGFVIDDTPLSSRFMGLLNW